MNIAQPLTCQCLNRHWTLGRDLLCIPPTTLPGQRYRSRARVNPVLPPGVPE